MERWIGRIAAVLVTVIAMFTIFAAVSWVIGRQVIDLADKLPDYQANIATKIRSLRLPAGGPLARLSSSVHALQNELVAPSPAPEIDRARGSSLTRSAPPAASPIPVKVIEGRNAIPQLMQETLSAILSPLGTAALVLLLVIFMLLKREDIRGRLIRLVGQGESARPRGRWKTLGNVCRVTFLPSFSSTRVTGSALRVGCTLSAFQMPHYGACWPGC